jgi:hypothetical protein
MDKILSFLDAINLGVDYLVTILFTALLVAVVIWYTVGKVRSYSNKGDDPVKGIFLGVVMLVEMAFLGFAIIWFPLIMKNAAHARFDWSINAAIFRWVMVFMVIPLTVYASTRKYSRWRGFFTALVIIGIALFGWQFEQWIGVFFIAFPIYGIMLYLIFHLAQVVLPSSNGADKKERTNKFMALCTYLLGVQFPVWIAGKSAGREFDNRINGNNFSGGVEPGIVWTHSHQVAGISTGITFNQVEGPGIIFTKAYERPIALVDLRTQIRTSDFDAITKDGIAFNPVIFAAFVIDFEDWPKKDWKRTELEQMREDFRQNPTLEKGMNVDHKVGSYHYSTARVKSVLSIAGINTNPKEGEAGPTINWDDWAIKQIENAARQVLSQRTMNELWRPVDDQAGKGALDEIAVEIRKIVEPKLRRLGIKLFASRVVNFNLPKDSPIRKQQIDSWISIWDQRIFTVHSEAEAIREEELQKAQAYAKSEILDAIADSIEKARAGDKDSPLPRHVIALYYIHAIEQIVQKQPAAGSQEAKERLDMVKTFLLYNH